MHSPDKNKFHLDPSDDSRVDQSFLHENERIIRKIFDLVCDFRNRMAEDFRSGKRIDWMDAFNNNFTYIYGMCLKLGIANEKCLDAMKLKTEIENKILFENRKINPDEEEKIYKLVDLVGVELDSILNK